MKIVTTVRKILLLLILLSPLALYLGSCKKLETVRKPANTLPILTTTTISSITATNATSGGDITSDGGLPVLSRGVVWTTISNPTIALSTKTSDGTGTGSFISNLTGLSPDTNYFVRAYATTSLGTAYGNELSFSNITLPNKLPILNTAPVSSFTATSVISGGTISSDGGLAIQLRGVVWSTTSNPTIALSTKTMDGTGTGSFISNLSGLSPDSTYFIRAYATTSLGTSYGNEVSFKFSSIGTQVGNKLVGSGAIGNARQGYSVAISADGNTLVFSGPDDNNTGAIWIYNRANNAWNQVAKLIGSDAVGKSFHNSVAISADGKTVILGGPSDNQDAGAAWIFTQINGIWEQQGSKLIGTGAVGKAGQGSSVSISSDGNTVVIGGVLDNTDVGSGNGFFNDDAVGAAWIFTRINGMWTQQGNKLVGSGTVGKASQGSSVSISGDGSTVVIGGVADADFIGAAWIFTRSNGIWAQQGGKLVGTGNAGGQPEQGISVSISGDGNTAVIGGLYASGGGAAWIFTRNNSMWAQQGSKLVGSGNIGNSRQGRSVSISGDGNTLVIGGDFDNGVTNSQGLSSGVGAAWIFKRNNDMWAQQGSKLVGSDNIGYSMQGSSVSINSDGKTVAVGGPGDNGNKGAVWIFNR